MSGRTFHKPIWDRGDDVDAQMMAFTAGDDWMHDQRLVEHDIEGSLAHVDGLVRVGLIDQAARDAIHNGLQGLLESFRAGAWQLEPEDEDVHSAVERRLIDAIGEPAKRMHTARSRNEQIALDVRLWLRSSIASTISSLDAVREACENLRTRHGGLPLPGYTHLRRAMPSSIGDWIGAHAAAFLDDLDDLERAALRLRSCPMGSGSGYGVPVELDREGVAHALGFDTAEEPVTYTQHGRGRPELAYVTALEQIALDLGKLAADLWLFTTEEFGFARLPVAWTTGSSLMPQKRNPDVLELVRAHCRQVITDRAALVDIVRDLPAGYHRDFQLIKPPLFRAHDRIATMLPMCARMIDALELDEAALRAAGDDEQLRATERVLDKAKEGVPFRDAYRSEAGK